MQSLSPCLFLQLGHKQNCLMRFLVVLCSWFSEASTRAEAGWFLSFGNRTQNSRVAGARPNHQPIGGSDLNHQGIWSPPRSLHASSGRDESSSFDTAQKKRHISLFQKHDKFLVPRLLARILGRLRHLRTRGNFLRTNKKRVQTIGEDISS